MINQRKLILLFLFFFPLRFFCQTIELSNPINVTDPLNQPVIRGRIGLVTGNVPVIVWGLQVAGANGYTYVSKLNNQNQFDPPVLIDIPNQLPQLSSSDITAQNDLVFVSMFVFENGVGKIFSAKSNNGATGFDSPIQVYPAQGGAYIQYPAINVFSDGNPSVSFMYFEEVGISPEYRVMRSWDGGLTYSVPVSATSSATGEACACCPSTTIIQNNTQMLLWRNNNNDIRTIYAAKSTNAGISFDISLEIDNTNWFLPACPASGPDGVLFNNILVSTWMSGVNNLLRIMCGRTDIGTMEVESNSFVDPNVSNNVVQNHPQVAGDENFIAIVWEDNRTNNTGIRIAVSTDGGNTFGSSVLVSDLAKNVGIAYKDSIFHIVYTDMAAHQIKYLTAQIESPSSVFEKENFPGSYILHQNYPNPFNPITKISYEIPETSPVTIRVYDVLGNEVTTLVDKDMSAGVYEVEFSAIGGYATGREAYNLTSGIYFYRLQAGDFIESKKMMLLK